MDVNGNLRLRSEILLAGGDGSDGSLAAASAAAPGHVVWAHGNVLFSDGCTVRRISTNRVQTLLGGPCAQNKTLEPMPWASRLSQPLALATEAAGTVSGSSLLLTAAGVIRLSEPESSCAGQDDDACNAEGCGWAESGALRRCFDCQGLQAWAAGQRPKVVACDLELEPRASTRYSLAGCGCIRPTVTPDLRPASSGSGLADVVQAFLTMVVLAGAVVAGILMYRSYRRNAALRELYGVDTAEFHTFHDDECVH